MTAVLARTSHTTDTIDGLARRLNTPGGGFTYDVWTSSHITEGFAVAVVDDAEQRIDGTVTRADIRDYALKHAELLRRPGMRLGGWREGNTGTAFLDISCVVETRAEAFALSARHNQLAFFDLSTGTEITMPRA